MYTLNKGLLGKAKIPIAILSIILIAIFVVTFVLPSIASESGSTLVWTDKADYDPGETVLISGSGFNTNTSLSISITRPDGVDVCPVVGKCGELPVTDETGSFSNYAYILNGVEGTYTVSVSDGVNFNQTTFTDTRTINWVKLNGSTSVIVSPSSPINVTINVTTTGTGSDARWRSTEYRIGSGSWTCEDHPDHDSVGNYNESFTINAPSTSGVYNVSFRAYRDDSCSFGQSSTYTLINGINVTSLCGNNVINLGEQCELPSTSDNSYCSQSTSQCSGNKSGTRDNLGNCNATCGCVLDSFTYQCVQGQCGATCDADGDCPLGQTCNTNTCGCTGTAWTCGNGIIEGSEQCDDGNTASGDGCSYSACQVETNWTCSGTPSKCYAINQNLTNSCGIDMVLIIDSSSSINSTELNQMKTAFRGFVDAFLPNTPTQIAVVDFDTVATVILNYSSNATAIKNAINSTASDGYTNWQDALVKAYSKSPNRLDKPDLYVFASDGNPNRNGSTGQTVSEDVAVAEAVKIANQIKLSGIRIVTLGIGDQLNASNLIAISSAYAYYQTNFSGLAQTLATLANTLCGGTISVRKFVDGNPASNWTFFTNVTGGTSNPPLGQTDGDGGIGFIVFNINITGTNATVNVTETSKGGYGFVNASCKKNNTPVGIAGTGTVTGIVIGKSDAVYCEFNNTFIQCSAYINLTACENNQNCDWCPSCSEYQWSGGNDRCVNAGSCNNYWCEFKPTVFCGAQCEDNSDCQPYCSGNIRNYNGNCTSGCTCTYSQENCDSKDDWYCNGNDREYRNYSCSSGSCTFIITQNQSCDDGNPCTSDTCSNGQCVHTPLTGTSCDDGLFCTVNDHCESGQCVGGGERNCSANNLLEIARCDNSPDDFLSTFDYAQAFTSQCNETSGCTIGTQTPSHTCADSNLTDGGPQIPPQNSVRNCNAECDGFGTECQPKLENDYCYYNGNCNTTPTVCACNYASSQYCPTPGNVTNGICYYGSQTCTADGCGLSHAEMGCKNYCDPNLGPKDTIGPTTYNLAVNPSFNNGIFNLTATTEDNCTVIKTAEYFVGPGGTGSCDPEAPVKGTIYPADDGSFDLDKLLENLLKRNIIYRSDGVNWACVKGQDNANNWGNCACVYFETDVLPPDCPYDIYLDKELYPDEYLICGNNSWLNATVCDQESKMQGGEYFIDPIIPPIPTPWTGYWMNTLYNFTRADSWKCAIIGAFVNTNNLSDGTHYIKLRGKDTAENWGKISECINVSFIRDTKPPITNKTLIPYQGEIEQCYNNEQQELPQGVNLTNGCNYVKGGTQIVLSAKDQDTPDHEFADKVRIHWIVWYKANPGDNWTISQQDVSGENQSVIITLSNDSYHLIEYWAVDACGWGETHHYELDIVDNQKPNISKTIIGPSYGTCPPQSPTDTCFIDGVTIIHIESTDPTPHPSDHATCDWDYDVMEGGKQETGQTELTPPFNISFPEESTHNLTIRCRDALGNENVDIEKFLVDKTPPTTTKTYGTPYWTSGGKEWINSSTLITLTVNDTGLHKSGIKETKYRISLVDDVFCLYQYDCQNAQGSGNFMSYVNPFTIANESCHLIEYYSVDNVNKTETTKRQCVYVENKPPISNKTLGQPQHECNSTEKSLYGINDCWYITEDTQVKLNCTDQNPHPSKYEMLYYTIEWKQNWNDSWTLLRTGASGSDVMFSYSELVGHEDSYHKLTWYCVDALNQKETSHVELDIVDTKPPVSTKILGNPQHPCNATEQSLYYPALPNSTDGCYFITQQTPINISCTDQMPHPVDHVRIYYRNYLVDTTIPGFIEVNNSFVTITKTPDSAHILEWYCIDELGNTETTHVEYDIVDTQAPNTTKDIIGPQFYNATQNKTYIDGVTEIELNCTDQQPHPVDHTDIYYRYKVNDGTWNSWTRYTGKFSFPEESKHELEYFCNDTLGNEETHKFEIDYVDKTAPVTNKTYGAPYYTNGLAEWINSSTPITLTATDGTSVHASGVNKTYYRVTQVADGNCASQTACGSAVGSGSFLIYSSPFTISNQSCHLIEFYSVDNVNKTEIIKRQCVYVENAAPISSKAIGSPKKNVTASCSSFGLGTFTDGCYYVTQQTQINLTCTDQNPHPVDNVKIYYKIDWKNNTESWTNGTWVNNSNFVSFTYPKDSYHRLSWYCVDALGNKEQTHTELDIVDTKPPVSTKSFQGTAIPCNNSDLRCANQTDCDYYVTQSTKIKLNCTDQQPHPVDNVTIYYRYFVDDVLHQNWTVYNGSIQYDEDSQHKLEWYCVDELGNTETTHVEYDRVDTTPPVTTKTVGQPNWNNSYWVTSQTPITLVTVDKNVTCASGPATLYYKDEWDSNCDGTVDTTIDSNTGHVHTDSNCNLNKTIYLNNECLHKITWHAVDALGNVEQEHVQYHKVDNTPPHVLILKPVDGWYSDGEDIPIVSQAEDLNNVNSSCEQRENTCDVVGVGISCGNPNDCNGLGTNCSVGITDGKQCYAYLVDVERTIDDIRDKKISKIMLENASLITNGTLLYNSQTKQCEGYATIPVESGLGDGVKILVVGVSDNLGNMADSIDEIGRAINERCGCDVFDLCESECVRDALQDIITTWNLPKIGIDNHAPIVTITQPIKGKLFGGEQVSFSADVIDSEDGSITSTITSGTPCYITIGGVSLGTVPYNNVGRKCSGTIFIPQDKDFPQGTQPLKVEIADNAGNLGSDTVNVNVDTTKPVVAFIAPDANSFVKDTVNVQFTISDSNIDPSTAGLSFDNGNSWVTPTCVAGTCSYSWDTATATDGMAYELIAKVSDLAGNEGRAERIVIVDNGAPEGVYVLDPTKNDIVQGSMNLKAIATDYVSGVQSVEIAMVNNKNMSIGWSCNAIFWNAIWYCDFDSTSLPDGLYEVEAGATDNVGHTVYSASVPFIIDNKPPTAPVLYVNNPEGNGYDTDGTVTWHWTNSEDTGSGIDYYWIDVSSPGLIHTKVFGTTFTVSDLWDGGWHAHVRAVDKAGHESDSSNEVVIIVDKTKPSPISISGTGIENLPYDTNGNYNVVWTGGNDANPDRFDIVIDGTTHTGASSPYTGVSSEGLHEYQVIAYDKAGWQTTSSFFDVFVDTISPIITENSQTSWGPIGWWFDYSIDDGTQSSGLLTPTYSGAINICSWNPDAKTGSCLVIGSANSLTIYVSDKAGHPVSKTIIKGEETNTDFTPPELLTTSPSGVINYNSVTLIATTNEPSICKYGTEDDYSAMTNMTGLGTTGHSADLGTLEDGLYVYHIKCEDMVGNVMEHSKTVVFAINTESQFCLTIPQKGPNNSGGYWGTGWNTFWLPQLILDDIYHDSPYPVQDVLNSLYNGENANFDMVWYFDGTKWLWFDPLYPGISTLQYFNDSKSLPYYIHMNNEDRLELNCP